MMNTMEHNNLKNLLEHLTEQPSKGCWSNIESQLNLLYPEAATQASMQGASSTASKSGSFFAKVAAAPLKATAITGSVAIVSAVSIIAIHSFTKNQESPVYQSQSSQNSEIILNQDTIAEKLDTYKISETTPIQQIDVKEESKPNLNSPVVQIVASPTPQNTVLGSQPIPANNPGTTTPSNVVNKPISNPKPIVTNVSHTPDPIIENQEIPLSIPVKISIPNIFTPNSDGYNDFFVIEGIENCTEPRLVVKNSSGKTIFQSSEYQNDWNAENCPDGVYIYYFVYKVNGIEEKMMGKVIVKR